VSALTGNDWNADRGDTVAEMARTGGFESISIAEKVAAIRDTLIVLSLQLVFRLTMFLRHLNY
jgi:hypothetical protein